MSMSLTEQAGGQVAARDDFLQNVEASSLNLNVRRSMALTKGKSPQRETYILGWGDCPLPLRMDYHPSLAEDEIADHRKVEAGAIEDADGVARRTDDRFVEPVE